MNKVSNISDLLLLFHRNERPIYFISATNFNLLGLDRPALVALCRDWGEKPFRGQQLMRWLHRRDRGHLKRLISQHRRSHSHSRRNSADADARSRYVLQ